MTRLQRSFALLFSAVMCAGCIPAGGVVIRPAPADQTLSEKYLETDGGWFTSDKILILDVDGMIADAESGFLVRGENPFDLFMEKVRRAQNDPSVKALVLRVDSPGGTVTASDTMYRALLRLKKHKRDAGLKFPVVAMMMGTAASGGYYISMAADEVHAMPATITGSIGVIMLLPNVTGLMDKIGVTVKAIKSGPRKDTGSPFRPMQPDEETYLRDEVIMRYYANFLEVVNAGRKNLTADQVKTLADGRIYVGSAAKENGLVDRLGSLEDAIARAGELAGLTQRHVVAYHRPLGWKNTIYAQGGAPAAPTVNVVNLNLDRGLLPTAPSFLYLWQPGL